MSVYVAESVFALGEDTFEKAQAVIKKTHVYLRNLLNEMKLAGSMMLQMMQDVITMTLDKFQRML